MFDFYFHYKYNGRFILNLKDTRLSHLTDILTLKKILVFFNIKGITDLSSNTVLSYLFFFKYYFGILPFFTNYQHEFKLNVHYYSFLIESTFFYKRMYSILYFFINDIYYMINKSNIMYKKDKNFLEYKNSLGFFNLKHNLYFRFFNKNHNNNSLNLFHLFKLKDSINIKKNES